MKNYKLYVVGGFVRDNLLGVRSNDIDYSFEFSEDFFTKAPSREPQWFFEEMNEMLESEGFTIHTTFPDCFTTKAKFPKGHINEKISADFVMCRKESYRDSDSRKPMVAVGTLYDDLLRRDFTVNAMAIDDTGVLIDPFNGARDLKSRILKCPIDAETSFMDDPLRMIRALRFAVTKEFEMDADISKALKNEKIWSKFQKVVSRERVRDELVKMFKFDTLKSINIFYEKLSPGFLHDYILKNDIWLKPTTELK